MNRIIVLGVIVVLAMVAVAGGEWPHAQGKLSVCTFSLRHFHHSP